MYFKQINEIVNGTKTQTRRICKNGEIELIAALDGDLIVTGPDGEMWVKGFTFLKRDITEVRTAANRLKWQVGRDYAVSPGRGKPGVWWHPETGKWAVPYTTKRYKFDGPQKLKSEMIIDGWEPLRIRLLSIRREPLQDITEADAIAEGYPYSAEHIRDSVYPPIQWYRELWESINGAGSWDKTGDVWVLTFTIEWSPSL